MIVFASRTGNVRSIVNKLGLPSYEVANDLVITKPYILIIYTDGLGEVPLKVENFIANEENQANLKGVVASGNVNFGMNFCYAADVISHQYNVPIIRKIDLRGTQSDIDSIKEYYNKLIGSDQ